MQAGLLKASSWIAAKWLNRLAGNSFQGTECIELAEFGAFEANLAEAVVHDHGADFLFLQWGAEIGMLCGGNHRGQRLPALPQPSRQPIASGLRESDSLPCADYGGGDLGSTWADLVSAQFWHCRRQPVVGLP